MQNLAQALANDEADYRLALRLEKIREYSSVEVEGEFDNAAAAKQYSKALKEGGLAVSPGQEAELAAQIEQSPIRDQLLATLDDWAYIAWVIGQHDVQQRLLQVARRVDPDAEWKDQVRDPSRWKDPEALKALAARKGADPAALARLSPQMLALLGRLLPRDEAEKWLRQAQALHPTDYWLNYHLAYKVGPISPPRAECYVRAMLAIRPTSVGAWASLGDVLFAQGDWPQAFAAYSKALEINPNDGEAYRRRASALKAQGKVKEAVAAYENALEVDRNNPVVHLSYGALLCDELRDYDAALARFNRAIELKPNYPQAYRNRGEALMRKGLADKAMADIRTALRLRPHYPEAYISLGDVLQMKGDSKRAITAYRTAIKLDPKNNGAHHNLGVAFYKGGSYNEAIVEFREAIWIQPKAPLHHHCLGHALRQKKLFDKALEAYGEALRLDPRRAKVWVDIGLTHELQGNYDPAIAAYHRAAELKPNNSNTYKMARDRLASVSNSLAWLLATSPDPKRRNPSCAVKHATRAVELSPRNPNYWNTLGVAHYRTGDWNATAAALGKSMQLRNGGDSFDWFILALAHWQLANKGEARNWYDKAVEWMDKNRPNDEQLRRFRAEAATLLEVGKKMD